MSTISVCIWPRTPPCISVTPRKTQNPFFFFAQWIPSRQKNRKLKLSAVASQVWIHFLPKSHCTNAQRMPTSKRVTGGPCPFIGRIHANILFTVDYTTAPSHHTLHFANWLASWRNLVRILVLFPGSPQRFYNCHTNVLLYGCVRKSIFPTYLPHFPHARFSNC